MQKLSALATRVTGKRWRAADLTWTQTSTTIYSPRGDEEGLLHEVLHWIVASDEERTWPNLALDAEEVGDINAMLPADERLSEWTPETPDERERQVCYLTARVYALRGWSMPRSSCASIDPATAEDMQWALERLNASTTSEQELAAALETGESKC